MGPLGVVHLCYLLVIAAQHSDAKPEEGYSWRNGSHLTRDADKRFFIIDDFKDYCIQTLDKSIVQHFNGGSMLQQTIRENTEAYTRLRVRPRNMRNVENINLKTNLLGTSISFPVGFSPTAMHRMAHSDGEIGTARAATKADTVMIVSIYGSTRFEEIAAEAPNAQLWLQMHIFKNRSMVAKFVRKAEQANFRAIVLTIDFPTIGKRLRDKHNGFDYPDGIRFMNFNNEVDDVIDTSVTWKALHWLTTITELPVVAKGILRGDDALLAIKHGAKAILVSNHGGRQFDGVPATIEALPEVVRAVNGRVPVYVDGGIRTGTDVFKALALGAQAAFIGRPVVWGLASEGGKGVVHVTEILKSELELAMTLAGCSSLKDIQKDMVVPHEYYRNQQYSHYKHKY